LFGILDVPEDFLNYLENQNDLNIFIWLYSMFLYGI